MASTSASKVSRLTENPMINMTKPAPSNDSGTATAGMMTLRTLPKNRKITTMTITIASISVARTSEIASSM